jgi:hypothetical protein
LPFPNLQFASVIVWHRYAMKMVLCFALIAVVAFEPAKAKADRVRVAVQKTGTLAWELDLIKRRGIDRKLDLTIDTIELASTEAGKVALKGGSADLILSIGCGWRTSARSAIRSCSIPPRARSAQ